MLNQKNFYFISAQVILWAISLGIVVIPQIINQTNNVLGYAKWQLLVDYFFNINFLTLVSIMLKYVYDRYIKLDNFKLWEIIKMLFLLFSASFLYYVVLAVYNYFMLHYIYKRPEVFSHPSQSFENQIVFLFGMSFIFFLWLIAYTIYKTTSQIKNNKIDKIELENSLKDAQLNAIKGQINPHFMFNSLNNIRGLILENPEKSREMITRLSEMLRYSLTKNDVDKITLEEEVEMIENFIAISQIQFEDRLQFSSNIDENTLRLQIPPMIIQILIENAVKHGIANLKSGGKIELNIKLENNNLTVLVSNTGNLVFVENSTQLGIQNIEKRLQLLYDETATFELFSSEDQVIASIKIPIQKL